MRGLCKCGMTALATYCAVAFCVCLADDTYSGRPYPSRMSGDEAVRAKDFAAAASFYGRYRQEAVMTSDVPAMKDAYDREIDALLFAGLYDNAEKLLVSYEKTIPDADKLSLALWRGEVFLGRRDAAQAEKLFKAVLSNLSERDPRNIRVMSRMAFVCELKSDFANAVKYYDELSSLAEKTEIGIAASRRAVLNLIAQGNFDEARKRLASLQLPEDDEGLLIVRVLKTYLNLRESTGTEVPETWASVRNPGRVEGGNELVFLTCIMIGKEAERRAMNALAVEAYGTAYEFATARKDAFDCLTRAINVLEKMDDVKRAEYLASEQMRLFNGIKVPKEVRMRFARLLALSGKSDDALDVYVDTVCRDGSIDDLGQALKILASSNAIPQAEKLYEEYFKGRNDNKSATDYKAMLYRMTGRSKEAGDTYLAAGDGGNKAMYVDAAEEYVTADKPDLAIAAAEKYVATEKGGRIYFILGQAYERKKDYDNAIKNFLICAGSNAKDVDADAAALSLYRAARLYMMTGRNAEAIPVLQKTTRNYKTSRTAPLAGYWLIHAYRISGNETSAERETYLLYERFPESKYAEEALLKLATYYLDTGMSSRAHDLLEQLLSQKKYPNIAAKAIYEKALLAFRAKDYTSAEAELKRLEEEYPNDENLSSSFFLRGEILREKKDYKNAIVSYEEAAKRRPGSGLEQAARCAVGDCLYAVASFSGNQADFKTAADAYRKVAEMNGPDATYRAMALYKAARSTQLSGDETRAFELYSNLLYLTPAANAQSSPNETFWVVKAIYQLELIANQQPSPDRIDASVHGAEWLFKAGLQDGRETQKKIRSLRQKKFKF